MKKFILGGLAAAAVIAPIALTAGSASAATTDANGVVTVTKGDVQSALGWNNKAFDNGADKLVFTAGAEKVIADYNAMAKTARERRRCA